jgi:PKD repeat protein
MKKIFLLFSIIVLHLDLLKSECVLVPLGLEARISPSTLIVEAKVNAQVSYWNADRSMIFTSHELLLSSVFKGSELLKANKINIITLGGQVGDKAVKVEPELELELGDIGIFLLVQKDGEWVSESGPQGYIKIDKYTGTASDIFNIYPAFSIQNKIKSITKLPNLDINSLLTKVTINNKRATPSVSSISPKTLSSGTSTVLTIKGLNFKPTIDTSSVQFKNADDGGASYIKALKRDFISWSDTMIKLIVRTKAGTGKIRLVIAGNGITTSTDTLKVSYAHLNVVSGDSIGYETQQIGMNSSNGITWKMNQRFYDSAGARGAFIRSLERWRCGTFINWDTLGHLSHSAIKPDGVNMCAWDTLNNMPNGVLAQCFSYWSGCFNPGLKWFVNELDIRFRIRPTNTTNWTYGTTQATSNQFHFESVATHELGHGHQMGHVINSAVVMHYSIANGQNKPNLSTDDINAGNYVVNKSGTSVCGKSIHSKLNSGNCAIVAPNANFRLSKNPICKNDQVTFTDSSAGNISAYAWDFGANATPATASGKGPHNCVYSVGGTKTIKLTISTITGNLVKNKNLTVQTDSKMYPNFSYLAAEKGNITFTNTANNPVSSKWYFGDGDSSTNNNPSHTYSQGGTYNVKLLSSNTCNTRDTTISIKLSKLNYYTNKLSACINEPVYYIDSSDTYAGNWAWVFPGGFPSTANGKGPHNVIYNAPGNKNATLSISCPGNNNTNQIYTKNNIVNIGNDTFTEASFGYSYYANNKVGFINQSRGSNMKYKWYFGDGDSSIEKNPIHQYTNANLKTVKLIADGNCGKKDTTITLRNFTAVNQNNVYYMDFYPNPSSEYIQIQSNLAQKINVKITDVSGKLVLEIDVKNGEKIDLNSISSGTYLVKMTCNEKQKNQVLQINH